MFDGRIAEGGELLDRERRGHPEMRYGSLPELGNLRLELRWGGLTE